MWRADLGVDDLQVPEGVRLVLAHRLQRVAEETRRVLASAAVVGRSFGLAQPEVRRWYARMLLDRKASGDCDRALTLLDEAIEMYELLEMPRHAEMAKELLKGAF